MKKTAIFAFILVLTTMTMGAQEGTFTIKGKVGKVNDGAVIRATLWAGRSGYTVACDTIRNGSFTLAIPAEEPQTYDLFIYGNDYPNYGILNVFGEPGKSVTVTGNDRLFGLWKVKSKVKRQKEYDRYIKASEKEHREMMLNDLKRRKQIQERAGDITPEERKKFNAYKDELGLQKDSLYAIIQRNNIAIMRETAVSEIWMDMFSEAVGIMDFFDAYCSSNGSALMELYESLDDRWKSHPKAIQAKVLLFPEPTVGVGDMMADAELRDLDGNRHMLSEYLGKYILLDFWGAGCGPCIMAMPELKELQEKYADKLTIIGINTDGNTKGWRQVTEEEGINWVNLGVETGSGLPEKYGVPGYPFQVIISPDGLIVDSWCGFGKGTPEAHIRKFFKITP